MILYDPGTIGLLIGGFLASGGAAGIVIGTVGQIIGWGLIVGITAYGAINQRRQLRHQQADAKAAYNASLSDRTATLLQAAPPWRIIYGRCVVGSDIVAMFTSDKTGYREDGTTYTRADAYKHLVMHIASHQVQAIHEVFINGIPLGPLDSNGIPTLTNDFHRTDSFGYTVMIGGGGTVNVAPPAASILQASTGFITVDIDNVQDVTGSCSITNGGNTITGPAGATVTYMANVSHWAVRAQLHLGTASQTVDTYLNSVVPSQWTSNHRLRGRAYAVITLDLEDPRFQGGPPGITFDVSGRLLTHPTTGQTVAHDNAALVIQDFLQQKWGYNTSSTSLVTNSWNTAIADCDARLDGTGQDAYDVAFTVDTGQNVILLTEERALNVGDGVRFTTTNTLPAPLATGTTYYISRKDDDTARAQDRKHFALATSVTNARAGTYIDITSAGSGTHTLTLYDYPAYTINGMFVTSESREALLEEFARAMAGTVTNIGRWYAFAGTWHTSVMDLDDDDLDGAISLPSADTDLEGLINGQRGQFIPAGSGTPIEYDPYQNATFRTADGEDLYDDFNYRWTNTRYRCRNLSRIRTEQIRSGQQLTIPAKLTALPLQPGDRIRVTSGELAITNKYYRVTDTQFGYTSPMVLSVIEDDSTIWDLADAATADPTPNSGLPSRVVSQLTLTPAPYADSTTGVYGSDGSWTPRVLVSWSAITDPYMSDQNAKVWVGWRLSSDTVYTWVAVPPDQRYAYLSGMQERQVIIVQAYAQNGMGDKGPPIWVSVTVTFTQADPQWTTQGTSMIVSGGRIVKTQAGSDGNWDAGVYSKAPIAGACEVSFVVPQTDKALMIGLNSDPTTDAGYASIDFAIYPGNDGHLYIEESGSTVYDGGASSYAASDTLTVRNRGPVIEYLRNATVVRRKEVAMNATLSLDSSFYNVGALATNLVFRALTPVPAQYRVSSIGFRFTTTPPTGYPGTLENVELGATAPGTSLGRSFNVATISRMTGLVTSFNSYDVLADTANATAMAAALNALDSTVVVVVWSYDEPQGNHLFGTLPAAMYRCGASHLVYDNLRYRSAYILIGIPGMGVGAGFEAYGGSVDDSTTDAYARASFQITQQGELVVNGQTFTDLLPGVITSDMLAAALAADIDGKIVSYWQTTAPGTATEGDLWYDTDDNYKVYRWTSGAWVLAADSRIAAAVSAAADAQSTADGKVVTFVQTSIPTSEGIGDLWFDSDDGYKMYRAESAGADQITAGEWVAYQFGTSALDPNARGLRRVVNAAASVTISEVIHIPDGYSWNDTIVSDSQFTAAYNGYAVVTFDGTWNTTGGYGQYSVQNTEATYDGWNLRSMSSQTGLIAMTITRTFQLTANTTYTFAALGAKISSGSTDAVLNGQLLVEVTYTG